MNLVNAKTALEQIYDIERLVLMKAWNVEIKDLRNGNMISIRASTELLEHYWWIVKCDIESQKIVEAKLKVIHHPTRTPLDTPSQSVSQNTPSVLGVLDNPQ